MSLPLHKAFDSVRDNHAAAPARSSRLGLHPAIRVPDRDSPVKREVGRDHIVEVIELAR